MLEGSRADMVQKIDNALLTNCIVADDGYVLSIDNDDGIDEAITNGMDSIWRLVRRYVVSNFK